MIFRIFTLILGVIISLPVLSADQYTVDPRHTFPGFEISHLGFSIQRGRFNETSGTVMFDKQAGKGLIDIKIKTASISTGLADLEKHLCGEDFLDAERYPNITYKSDNLTFKDGVLTAVDGQLTLHGVTKPVHLTVDYFHCGLNMISMKSVCGANATATIKRSDFDVDKYAPALANDVHIEIQIEAIKD